ncbi:MAG: DoxX family protein [Flavobacteriales bacterium]|nr:DoxX family protein [Flavobacteriales bacterium]
MQENVKLTLMSKIKVLTVYSMGFLYLVVGIQHFTNPSFFEAIVPPFFVYKEALVYISGFIEIAIAILLVVKKTRKIGAYITIGLLVAVFPANIFLYMSETAREVLDVTKHQALIRMPFQIPLIIIAYWHSQESSSNIFSIISCLLFIPTLIYFVSL